MSTQKGIVPQICCKVLTGKQRLNWKRQCLPGARRSGPAHPKHLAPNALSIVFKTYEHGAYLLSEFSDTK